MQQTIILISQFLLNDELVKSTTVFFQIFNNSNNINSPFGVVVSVLHLCICLLKISVSYILSPCQCMTCTEHATAWLESFLGDIYTYAMYNSGSLVWLSLQWMWSYSPSKIVLMLFCCSQNHGDWWNYKFPIHIIFPSRGWLFAQSSMWSGY